MPGARDIRSHGRGRLLAARFLLMTGAVVLLVGGAEWLTARLAPVPPLLLLPESGNCLRRDPALALSLTPNCSGDLAGTPMRTNSLGLRGPEPRGDAARRVLAIGDSSTMGWRVAEAEAYPAVLEALLNARPDAPRVEVLNAGVAGYTSHQGLIFLRDRGMALEPDLLLIAFGWNDQARLGDITEQITAASRRRHLLRIDDWLLRQSHLYRWARAGTADPAAGPERPVRVEREQMRRNLEEMVRMARARGVPVILISFLRPTNFLGHAPAIQQVATDLETPLIVYDGDRLDLVHPTAAGYRALAEQLAAAIDERGYLR